MASGSSKGFCLSKMTQINMSAEYFPLQLAALDNLRAILYKGPAVDPAVLQSD